MVGPLQLLKTEKLANQLQQLINHLTMKNWLTTLHGVVIIGILLAKIWAPPAAQSKLNDTIYALTASGFFVAKDFNQHSTQAETNAATSKEISKKLNDPS